jgi:hypothetical protein
VRLWIRPACSSRQLQVAARLAARGVDVQKADGAGRGGATPAVLAADRALGRVRGRGGHLLQPGLFGISTFVEVLK